MTTTTTYPPWLVEGARVLYAHKNPLRYGRAPLRCTVERIDPARWRCVALAHPDHTEPIWAMMEYLKPV